MSETPDVLALTSIFSDPDLQKAHDNEVKAWLGLEAWTVLDFFSLPDAPVEGEPEEKMEWLVNKIRQLKPEMRDCSIDHYWRDVLEESTGLPVTHLPFPVK
jgi:hypothetical protein